MPSPQTNAITSGQFQTGEHREDEADALKLVRLVNDRTPLVAKITALDTVYDNQFVGDVYVGTSGLSIASGTVLYTQTTIINCDPHSNYNVNSLCFVNMVIHGIALIVPLQDQGLKRCHVIKDGGGFTATMNATYTVQTVDDTDMRDGSSSTATLKTPEYRWSSMITGGADYQTVADHSLGWCYYGNESPKQLHLYSVDQEWPLVGPCGTGGG